MQERYRWIMRDVVLIEKTGERPMHGSQLYQLFLDSKLSLHECQVRSAEKDIQYVLQLKKYVDIYKKILDIDKAKEQEKMSLS